MRGGELRSFAVFGLLSQAVTSKNGIFRIRTSHFVRVLKPIGYAVRPMGHVISQMLHAFKEIAEIHRHLRKFYHWLPEEAGSEFC